MSASRPIIAPYHVVVDHSMGATFTSTPTIITNLSMISYDIAWSAGSTPVGVITVEVSNTYALNADGSVRTAGNWTTLALSSTCSVSGNTGNGAIDVDLTGFYAIRLKYTRTSGSGTMNVTLNAKVA